MQSSEYPTKDDEWKQRGKSKPHKKRFGIATRHKPRMTFDETPRIHNGTKFWRSIWLDEFTEWRMVNWYEKERDRDEALKRYQNKTPFMLPNGKINHEWVEEYRKIER